MELAFLMLHLYKVLCLLDFVNWFNLVTKPFTVLKELNWNNQNVRIVSEQIFISHGSMTWDT